MKAKQVFDKLIENWQIKAVCFVIALFLYVVYQTQSVDKKVFSVPLTVESKNGYVSIEPHPRTVAVSARGKAEDLAQVRESDLKAYLDLSYVSSDGSYDFPVLLNLSDSASVLNPLELKVTPEIVRLKVEEEITAFVDIVPLVSGKPADGYLLKAATVKPDQIAITGPRTMIQNCKSLQTLSVSMSNARTAFTSKVKVEKKGMFITHDDIEVAVTVELEEAQGSKQFTKLPVTIRHLSPELEVRAMTREVTVTLEGSVPALERFTPAATFVTADASAVSAPGTVYLELSYSVPRNLSLADGYTKSIPVTFAAKEVPVAETDEEEKITVVETAGGELDEKVE
ncbi:MAG: hypothetical protein IJ558_01400 [Treponema sp.]|nr:hypothetical protein [Treponema sp.]